MLTYAQALRLLASSSKSTFAYWHTRTAGRGQSGGACERMPLRMLPLLRLPARAAARLAGVEDADRAVNGAPRRRPPCSPFRSDQVALATLRLLSLLSLCLSLSLVASLSFSLSLSLSLSLCLSLSPVPPSLSPVPPSLSPVPLSLTCAVYLCSQLCSHITADVCACVTVTRSFRALARYRLLPIPPPPPLYIHIYVYISPYISPIYIYVCMYVILIYVYIYICSYMYSCVYICVYSYM
jgi:hypothetical protein